MMGPYVPAAPEDATSRNGRESVRERGGAIASVYVAPALVEERRRPLAARPTAAPDRAPAPHPRGGGGGHALAGTVAPAEARDREGDSLQDALRSAIRIVRDFPRTGDRFPDVTPLFQEPKLLRRVVRALVDEADARGAETIAGIDPRGILLGPLLALRLDVPFVPIAAPGTLAGAIRTAERRGAAAVPLRLAIHRDRVKPGQRVVLVDDLLVSGATATTAAGLVEDLGGIVAGLLFLAEDPEAGGRRALGRYNVCSLLKLQHITSERV